MCERFLEIAKNNLTCKECESILTEIDTRGFCITRRFQNKQAKEILELIEGVDFVETWKETIWFKEEIEYDEERVLNDLYEIGNSVCFGDVSLEAYENLEKNGIRISAFKGGYLFSLERFSMNEDDIIDMSIMLEDRELKELLRYYNSLIPHNLRDKIKVVLIENSGGEFYGEYVTVVEKIRDFSPVAKSIRR